MDSARRKLGWFILFAYIGRDMLDEFTKMILDTHLIVAYRKNTSLEDITDPNLVLDMMLRDPIDENQFIELATIITYMFGFYFENLSKFMIEIVKRLTKGNELGFDNQKMGAVLCRYLLEMANDNQIATFWNHVEGNGLHVTVERLSNRADRQLIFRSFLKATYDHVIIDSFDHDIWTEALNDSDTLKHLRTRVENPIDINDMRKQVQEKLKRFGIDLDPSP